MLVPTAERRREATAEAVRAPDTATRCRHRPCPLTTGEMRVVALLAEGLTYEEIAAELGRATSTVRSQLQSAYRRLGVATSYQAVLTCARRGWLTPDGDDPEDRLLRELNDVLRELVDAVATRDEVNALTPSQRRYLAAFDQRLHARSHVAQRACRREMETALTVLLADTDVDLSDRRRPAFIRELGDIMVGHMEHSLSRP